MKASIALDKMNEERLNDIEDRVQLIADSSIEIVNVEVIQHGYRVVVIQVDLADDASSEVRNRLRDLGLHVPSQMEW